MLSLSPYYHPLHGLKTDFINLCSVSVPSYRYKNHATRNIVIAADAAYRFSRLGIAPQHLFHDLLTQYWQENIFISTVTTELVEYINVMYEEDEDLMAEIDEANELFAMEFSKELLHNNIYVNPMMRYDHRFLPDDYVSHIKYLWRKGLNFAIPINWYQAVANFSSCYLYTPQQKMVVQQIKDYKIPLFVVVNDFYQLVLSEPADNVSIANNLKHIMYKWYADRCFASYKTTSPIYQGWFFINPQDALEYADYIQSQYHESLQYYGTQVIPTKLVFYYWVNRLSPPSSQIRIMPDLTEIGKLVTQPKFRRDLIFHDNQLYGSDYFQGQPIYYINLDSVESQKLYHAYLEFHKQLLKSNHNQASFPFFFSKEVAISSWKRFIQSNSRYQYLKKPIWTVYNLEDLLKDYEAGSDFSSKNLLFMPSYDMESQMRILASNPKDKGLKFINNCQMRYEIWSKRIWWSLTSRQSTVL